MSRTLWVGPPGGDDHQVGRWLNSYIWTVPGSDPYGPAGPPRATGENYVWATVSNTHETDPAIGAVVEFYFCHYGTAPQRSARLIGSSRVDIAARGSEDVLCVVPLSERRDGCLQVVVRHWLDALPADWTPMAERYWNHHTQVGYLNLRVVDAPVGMVEAREFEVSAPGADSTIVEVNLNEGFLTGGHRDQLLDRSGIGAALPYDAGLAAFGLSHSPEPSAGWEGVKQLSFNLPHGESQMVYILTQTADGPPGFMGLNAVARADGRTQGGVSIVVVRSAK